MHGTYAVIGDPITHSLSPTIHNAAFRELDMDCSYIAYRIDRDDLDGGLHSLVGAKIAGFNVTIPHKVGIMGLLDSVDDECTAAGACNTVCVQDGRLEGHNTDIGGFLDPLERRKIDIEQSDILVLGAGGSARAIVYALSHKNAHHITVAARSEDKARSVADIAKERSSVISFADASSAAHECDIVINATPLGMNGEPSPIRAESMRAESVIYDIVYRPLKTPLILEALKCGASVIYGYEMLLGQAMRSFEIWHKVAAPYDSMKHAILGVRMP